MDVVGLVESVRQLFSDFHAGSFVGIASLLYIIIQVLRGKMGFNIPWLTNLFNKIESKAIKTYIILGLFILAGGFTSLSSGSPHTFWTFIDGMLAGLSVGVGTLGARTAVKTTMEIKSVQSLKTKVLKLFKKEEVTLNDEEDNTPDDTNKPTE